MQICPRCHRVNPEEAAYCHFDGFALRTQAISQPHGKLVFASGRVCTTLEELAAACSEEWDAARTLLKEQAFAPFLVAVGRSDLLEAAVAAARQPNADLGLSAFLEKLPPDPNVTPELDITPRRLNLEAVPVGEKREVRLQIRNLGKGLLHGRLTVSSGQAWLSLGGGEPASEMAIRCEGTQQCLLRIDTSGLAAPHHYAAKLTLVTNGGVAELPVHVELRARPFGKAPFENAATPREMAEQMRLQPKAAAPLLENGEIAAWFVQNGWKYPISGFTARGIASVQQFFEGMGFSKPPPLRLVEGEIKLLADSAMPLTAQIVLQAQSRKWVFVHAETNASWLTLPVPLVSGVQQAVVPLEARPADLASGMTHQAIVRLVANGGQTFEVPVRLDVPRANPPKQRAPQPRPLLVGALAALLIRLLLFAPMDGYARWWAHAPSSPPAGTLAAFAKEPLSEPQYAREFVFATWPLGGIVGALLLWRLGNRNLDVAAGLITGSAAGLMIAGSLACLMPLMDAPARWVAGQIVASAGSWVARESVLAGMLIWLVLVSAHALLGGALLGPVVARLGPWGLRTMEHAGQAVDWCLRVGGWQSAAA